MKTDSLFYRLFLEFPQFFFELIDRPPEAASILNSPKFCLDKGVHFIYPSRKIEREEIVHFGSLLQLSQVRRIYLNKSGGEEGNLGIGVVKLVVEAEAQVANSAKRLIQQAQEQLTDKAVQNNLIDLIETIVISKLPQKSRQELEAMLSLEDFKKRLSPQSKNGETAMAIIYFKEGTTLETGSPAVDAEGNQNRTSWVDALAHVFKKLGTVTATGATFWMKK